MIYSIVYGVGEYSDYHETTIFTSLDLEEVTKKYEELKAELVALFYDMAIDGAGDCAEYYNVSETLWRVARGHWWSDGVDLMIREIPVGVWVDGHKTITREWVKSDSRFVNEEERLQHMYDLPPATRYEILARPFEILHFGEKH